MPLLLRGWRGCKPSTKNLFVFVLILVLLLLRLRVERGRGIKDFFGGSGGG